MALEPQGFGKKAFFASPDKHEIISILALNIESLLYRNFRDFHPKLLNCKRPGVLYRSLSYHFPDNVVGSDHSGAPDCGLFGNSGSSSVPFVRQILVLYFKYSARS